MADLFAEDQTATEIDPAKDYFSELVGEGKKFADEKALARAKAESDLFIEKVKQDNAALREELKQKVAFQEVLDQLKSMKTPPEQPQEQTNSEDKERKYLTQEELDTLLETKLAARKAQADTQTNVELVQAALVKAYGSDDLARAEINRKAKELDVKPDVLRQMAQTSPKAFLALMIETSKAPLTMTPRTSMSTTGSEFKPTGARTQRQWDELRKRDPVAYHSKELTIQRHKNAMETGEAWFDV